MSERLAPQPPVVAIGQVMQSLAGTPARLIGDPDIVISGVELDSRRIRPGDLFAAMPGHQAHGIAFADDALAHGAKAILTDESGLERLPASTPAAIVVPNPRSWLGRVCSRVYGNPAEALTLLGVTGTNGKTTVSFMVNAGLRAAGRTTGLIGTVGISIQDTSYESVRTTPEAPHLQAMLAAMREHGVDAVAVEVSSHAIAEHRVDAVRFTVVGFTNLSQDHLDYHGTMEAYFQAKAQLFTPERAEFAVIGVDDPWGQRLASAVSIPYATWSAEGHPADWMLERSAEGWQVLGPRGECQPITVPLPGAFNRANALCAYAMLRRVGIPGPVIAEGLSSVRVPGRMEPVAGGGSIRGIVDYAHSPDAIERVLLSAREQTPGRILVVLGAGGDRDRSKRPLMGAAAARLADVLVVTDDNPRSEDPDSIRHAIIEGAMSVTSAGGGSSEQPVGRSSGAVVQHVADRREAIRSAVALAQPGDTVLVLGKGHELGQEIAGVVYPFDDSDELTRALVDLGTDR